MVSLHISSEQQEGKNRADLQKVYLPGYSSCISAENYFSLYWLPHKDCAEDSYGTYQSTPKNFEFFGLLLKYKKRKKYLTDKIEDAFFSWFLTLPILSEANVHYLMLSTSPEILGKSSFSLFVPSTQVYFIIIITIYFAITYFYLLNYFSPVERRI